MEGQEFDSYTLSPPTPPSQKHTNIKGSYDNQGVSFKVVPELGG